MSIVEYFCYPTASTIFIVKWCLNKDMYLLIDHKDILKQCIVELLQDLVIKIFVIRFKKPTLMSADDQ